MALKIDQINPHSLPPLLQELADLIGLPAALKLAGAYPGVPVYIPSKPHQGHHLSTIVGYDNLKRLSEVYGQSHLKMPNMTIRKMKHQIVQDLRAEGKSIREAALATGFTTRRVEQLCASDKGAKTNTRQTDLFRKRD
ncbi:hypothetical protein OAA60_02470 [Porticoccaceae bacterium]|nr:hypothetical protein [Porticoccaceae bacterium]